MRILGTMAAAALMSSSTLAAASADYYLQIKGVGRDAAAGPIYLLANIGDLDGDGVTEEATVRLSCAGGELRAAHYNVKSPRDSASGMASGKRTHHPVTFVKEWGASTPQFRSMKITWNPKSNTELRMAAGPDGWAPMTLSSADGLCPAAEAAVKATKSRSNIQNN
jgi:hypothetical protein